MAVKAATSKSREESITWGYWPRAAGWLFGWPGSVIGQRHVPRSRRQMPHHIPHDYAHSSQEFNVCGPPNLKANLHGNLQEALSGYGRAGTSSLSIELFIWFGLLQHTFGFWTVEHRVHLPIPAFFATH
ncbi:hypothetical protein PPTG_05907 [Phytophthora nicotianae INRA-310]|uniref:Uncharacterized protein n=1 Tax=Phytophthora nicotianae (strain INRA-310) TaxID=761204 RepID=W2QX10_PHYN3|nr:hypothetical protein PPTG_05907 [Phytophthora nicotianae INRA-310]ETN16785.1 hypothetical protein PPTG_05907 [Phytophthora nicotianae INRA-310]